MVPLQRGSLQENFIRRSDRVGIFFIAGIAQKEKRGVAVAEDS